jgi:hypothetical protein
MALVFKKLSDNKVVTTEEPKVSLSNFKEPLSYPTELKGTFREPQVSTKEPAKELKKEVPDKFLEDTELVTFKQPEVPQSNLKELTVNKVSVEKDKNDHHTLRHGRTVNDGTLLNKIHVQTPPMFFTRDGHNLWLGDQYRGSSCFLILGGPSFGEIIKKDYDFKGKKRSAREILNYPGFVTMGVNNSVKTFRPNLWTCVDDPQHFIKSIWLDPKIQKIVPFSFPEKKLFDNESWQEMNKCVGGCPNVIYYRRNEKFNADQFFFEDTINWGNHTNYGGSRSVMLAAFRILFHMGIRNLYLLGADFNMDENTKYHFDQDRSKGSISGNNSTYNALKERFKQLKPICDELGYNVFNCNLESKLDAFPKIRFEDAIEMASKDIPVIETERTDGLYDREAKKKEAEKKLKKEKKDLKGTISYSEEAKKEIKEKLDVARSVLTILKVEYENNKTPENDKKVKDARSNFKALEAEKNKIWGISR